MENGIKFSLNIDRLFRYHLMAIGFFALAHILTVAAISLFGFDTMMGLTHLFALEGEGNLPTCFSACSISWGAQDF